MLNFILLRKRLLAAIMLLLCGIAVADTSLDAAAEEPQSSDVVVEGRRIDESPNEELPSQVTSVDRQVIESIGARTTEDVLRRLPAALNSTTRASSVGFDFDFSNYNGSPFPTALANLRDLGTDRTLVLVNGRRHVAGSGGSTAVDINSIPLELIERVDLITGAAAAQYGGDAAAGALNFVLKRDYQGFSSSAQVRQYGAGFGQEYSVSALGGLNFGPEERGNVTVAVDWTKRSEVNALNSGLTQNRIYSLAGNPNLFIQPSELTAAMRNAGIQSGDFVQDLTSGQQALLSSSRLQAANDPRTLAYLNGQTYRTYNDGGGFAFDLDGDRNPDFLGVDLDGNGVDDCRADARTIIDGHGCWTLDDATRELRAYRPGPNWNGWTTADSDGDIYPPNDIIILNPRYESAMLSINGGYELTERARAFIETKFVDSESRNRAGNGTNVYPNGLTEDGLFMPIRLDNPFIPAALRGLFDDYAAANPGSDLGNAHLLVNRDLFSAPGNRDPQRSRTLQIVGGIEGSWTDRLKYQVSGQFGSTHQRNSRLVTYADRLVAALDVATDPQTGEPVCRSSLDPGATPPAGFAYADAVTFTPGDGQCRPYNPFGPGGSFPAQNQDVLDFINQGSWFEVDLEQVVFQAALNGDLGETLRLPAGPIGFTLGSEYRRESSRSQASQNVLDGYVFGVGFGPIAGSIDVKDVYGNFVIPVLSGKPFARELTVTATGRYSDYEFFGETFTWGTGLAWSPVDSLRVRSSIAHAVRVPTVSYMFEPRTSSVAVGSGFDPCDFTQIDLGPRPDVRRRNCEADGIPAGFQSPVLGSFTEIGGSNPGLAPEKAKTFTAGLVLQPSRLPRLAATLDYYRIEIDDSMEFVSYDVAIAACYDSPSTTDNIFCRQFSRNRDPDSPSYLAVDGGTSQTINFGRVVTSGVDMGLQYGLPLAALGLENGGDLGLSINATRVLGFDEYRVPGEPTIGNNRLGEFGTPEWTAVTDLIWTRGRFDASWNTLWYGQQLSTDEETLPFIATEFGGPANHLDAVWVHDLSVGFEFRPGLRVRLGVNNVTDEKPPRFLGDRLPVDAFGPSYFLSFNYGAADDAARRRLGR